MARHLVRHGCGEAYLGGTLVSTTMLCDRFSMLADPLCRSWVARCLYLGKWWCRPQTKSVARRTEYARTVCSRRTPNGRSSCVMLSVCLHATLPTLWALLHYTYGEPYFGVEKKNDLLLTAVLSPPGLGSVVHRLGLHFFLFIVL